MKAVRVGIREFREKLASYLLESDRALAITCHGETIGYYISTRRKRAEKERAALKESASQLQRALSAQGTPRREFSRILSAGGLVRNSARC